MRWLWLFLILLLLGLQYRLWFGEPSLPDVWALQEAIKEQQKINQSLAERNTQLEAEVNDLKEGMSALEERARSEMGMLGEGETFFQVIEPEEKNH